MPAGCTLRPVRISRLTIRSDWPETWAAAVAGKAFDGIGNAALGRLAEHEGRRTIGQSDRSNIYGFDPARETVRQPQGKGGRTAGHIKRQNLPPGACTEIGIQTGRINRIVKSKKPGACAIGKDDCPHLRVEQDNGITGGKPLADAVQDSNVDKWVRQLPRLSRCGS